MLAGGIAVLALFGEPADAEAYTEVCADYGGVCGEHRPQIPCCNIELLCVQGEGFTFRCEAVD